MVHPNVLDQQIENLRTLQQSYDQIAGAAEAYNVGKTQLAAAITSKGVETSPTETYPEMAEKVAQIPLVTTEIDGGEMYAAQQFGDGALWNLYQVLADMKTRFMGTGDYAALIVCEYYKGYDSLQLQGADAYYTCDGDYYDTSMPLHVWHDSDNGKANRWVCFLYATEGARFDITNTAISPRSMYIGGHIGTIEYFVNGRLTELVSGTEETDIVDDFIGGNYTQNFVNRNIVNNVCNVRGFNSGSSQVLNINFVQGSEISISSENIIYCDSEFITIKGIQRLSGAGGSGVFINGWTYNNSWLRELTIDDLKEIGSCYLIYVRYGNVLQRIAIKDLERLTTGTINVDLYGNGGNLIDIEVGSMTTNLRVSWWNPTTVLADADKKAQLIDNIKNHILARVGDATGGTQLVFTVSTNMYNNIASEQIEWQGETMSLADAFLTKNWLLAGA